MNTKNVRAKTISRLKENNVPMHPHLPLIDIRGLRSTEEVCEKIIALYSLAGLANGATGIQLKEWLINENAWGYLSKTEQELINNNNLKPEELNEVSWKQESLYTLCWAGGITNEIVWPKNESDLSDIFQHIPPEKTFTDFFRSFKLIPLKNLVEQLDLYYCLHASVVHPELWKDTNLRDQLKIEVILERRQALEWLCSKSIKWDEVSLDT